MRRFPFIFACVVPLAGMMLVGCQQENNPPNLAQEAPATEASGCCGQDGCDSKNETASCCEGGTCQTAKRPANSPVSCGQDCDACQNGDSASCQCDAESDKADPIAAEPDGEVNKEAGKAGDGNEQVNSIHEDRDIFHFLLNHHDEIERTVTELDNGVTTVTKSSNAEVAKKIQQHVASMYRRVEDRRPVRMWDQLYREIFAHSDKINMEIRKTEQGISVTETSDDPYVAKLIKAHAKVVSKFVERGFDEARLNHEPPSK
ncbi:MAG: hypothetical protein AAFN77_15320 [Planctomycetota bacterium]